MAPGTKKVLYLINSMTLGGAERQMAELVRRVPSKGFEPVLCTLEDENAYPELLPGDQPKYTIGKPFLFGGTLRLLEILRAEKPDIVHSFMERSNLWNRVLSPLIRNENGDKPLVISSVRSRMMRPDYALIEALLAIRCDAITVNSIGTRNELVAIQKVPGHKIRVIPNILDLERFEPADEKTRKRMRSRLSLSGVTFLVPGRISVAKHQIGLVLAVSRLKKRKMLPDDARFLLAGRTYNRSVGGLLPRLIGHFDLEKHFSLLGRVSRIQDFYAATDWVLLPSLYEGLPNAALEAHACRIPLLVSHAANLDGIAEDGVTGIEFGTGRIDSMALALERAINMQPDRARELGVAGRQRVMRLFDPDSALESVAALYEELLEKRTRIS